MSFLSILFSEERQQCENKLNLKKIKYTFYGISIAIIIMLILITIFKADISTVILGTIMASLLSSVIFNIYWVFKREIILIELAEKKITVSQC